MSDGLNRATSGRSGASQAGQAVWKFELRPWSIFIDMPKGARLLSVGVQGAPPVETAVLWALCDPSAPLVSRLVAAHPTGPTLPPALAGAEFVGTVTVEGGIVLHIFDGGERDA